MINIAVCDDEAVYADTVGALLSEFFREASISASVTAFTDPAEFSEAFRSVRHDVVFLDIDMPGQNGFELAGVIREASRDTPIIFVSSKEELVFDSMDYHPYSFVRKESGEPLAVGVRKVAMGLLECFRCCRLLQINDIYRGPVSVQVKDVLYVRSDNHHLYYRVTESDRPLKERVSMSEKAEELEGLGFIKPHRRYLVNSAHIVFFSPKVNKITLDNKEIIPVSSGYHGTSHEEYLKFKRNNWL